MRLSLAWLALLTAGCTAIPPPSQPAPQPTGAPVARPRLGVPPTRPAQPPPAGFRAPEIMRLPGLEGVIGQGAAGLMRQLGQPRLDAREGDMRKLQFAGPACVLDVYLYPLREGAEPVATHVEARRASDGVEVDRAACVQALAR